MAKIERDMKVDLPAERCFEILCDVFPATGVRIVSSDASTRTIVGRFIEKNPVRYVSRFDRDARRLRELSIKCECSPLNDATTSVILIHHRPLQLEMTVSPEIPAKMLSILEALDQYLVELPGNGQEQSSQSTEVEKGDSKQQIIQAQKLAANLAEGGLSAQQIEGKLLERGYNPDAVSRAMADAIRRRKDLIGERIGEGKEKMQYGALIVFGGLLVFVETESILLWGAMLLGVGLFLAGLDIFRSAKRYERSLEGKS